MYVERGVSVTARVMIWSQRRLWTMDIMAYPCLISTDSNSTSCYFVFSFIWLSSLSLLFYYRITPLVSISLNVKAFKNLLLCPKFQRILKQALRSKFSVFLFYIYIYIYIVFPLKCSVFCTSPPIYTNTTILNSILYSCYSLADRKKPNLWQGKNQYIHLLNLKLEAIPFDYVYSNIIYISKWQQIIFLLKQQH